MQKFVLASLIDEDLTMKLNLAKGFMDQMKAYINPEFFRIEHGKEESNNEYEHKNIFFEHQTSVGRSTGKLTSPGAIKDKIASFYKNKAALLKKQKIDDSEVLG